MWQPATERLQHIQTILKTKLNVLTLRKDAMPTVIFHEPEDIELRSTTPLGKNRTQVGYKVNYLGKVRISGSQFLTGCTEAAVIGLWESQGRGQGDAHHQANALLEIRPFQVRLRHLDASGEADVAVDTYQVARIAYCTADHGVSPAVFAWIYRQIEDDLSFQMHCHAVECQNKMEAKRLAHAMMEAFRKTFNSMSSSGHFQPQNLPDDDPASLDDS
ncbi:hypothetical protein AGOR_G00237290 [Albula goreensis]|uniref:PID domain-containing protein n=1 Tax=Albula goreensis TaxID=1534307 RepID=A0A8T3CF67_9TELE|nr:hypothetical protein AGOR_G00237290 [Albula goreensis]